ncbi:hypothetical protein GN244_ATG19914 [Phytophthora infestans]|uniref:Uncharacterized protein n=1 Tax=Phytophthora infestans TaxID=4787 RepID=A0A833SG24_PHYIN|nr:hypothetical protein GN244_ATG19914 [Phytophthora infestans]
MSIKADALEIAAEELERHNPFDFYEASTNSTPSSKMIFPQLLPLQTPLLKDQCLAMPLDTDDMLEIPDDDNDSASLASYDSEEFGLIAGKGFARMYVLSRKSRQCDEDSKEEAAQTSWTLLYASGQHYFHGSIEMPEDIQVREEDQSQSENFFESISRRHEGDDVVDLTSGQRDAVYQMRELASSVEELAKPRTTERLKLKARELPWLAEATEKNIPAFFELQTHPTTNNALADAGVRLVVTKIVKRGVLLDIIYTRDSSFATLRDNTEEIALEDIFVPDVVFQFNQFGYHGSAQLPTRMLDDSGDLVSRGFPMLRAQASEVAFAGVGLEAEFPRTKVLSRFASVHRLFQEEIGNVLLDLLIGAQKWVHSFMREAPTASGGNELIATHLARWLEIKDGSEAFFELELARGSLCPFGWTKIKRST